MDLSDFRPRHVPGLYMFDHFEAPNGAFIQRHVDGGLYVYQDADGKRSDHYDLESLRAAVAA